MKKAILITGLLLGFILVKAQPVIEILVTGNPIVQGESFQIQYVVDDVAIDDEFFQPEFKGFRLVRGPETFSGSAYGTGGLKKLKNIVFTLEPLRAGKFILPDAGARINGKLIRSKKILLEVISKEAAAKLQVERPAYNDDYFLRPGEDPYKKIRPNLFVKVLVDKKSCFVGEAIVATFKLYSRLESRSDIVKNPGFYGFTVQDMIGLGDKLLTQETINGKQFNVHTIRKVQLYPLQAGSYTVDAMEVMNKVRFSRSAVNKRTEQEISEGVYADPEKSDNANTEEFESSMHTEPVLVTVKPAPVKNQPADFDGATGHFTIEARVENPALAKNEEGQLLLTIRGDGNFTQLADIPVDWPAGIDGFNPVVKDSLDHSQAPMKGARSFRYRFVSAKPGDYVVPAIRFSFFDPDSNRYRTVSTGDINVRVDNREKPDDKKILAPAIKKNPALPVNPAMVWLVIIVMLVIMAAWWTWRKETRRSRQEALAAKMQPALPAERIPAEKILQPAYILQGGDDKTFYAALRQCIWQFLAAEFALTGSNSNKYQLSAAMQARAIDPQITEQLLHILEQCEAGMFTDAETGADKEALLEKTKQLLDGIGQNSA